MAFKKVTNAFAWLTAPLVTIGAVHLGLQGVFNFMGREFLLIDTILFQWEVLINIVYTLIGISGVLLIPTVLAMMFRK